MLPRLCLPHSPSMIRNTCMEGPDLIACMAFEVLWRCGHILSRICSQTIIVNTITFNRRHVCLTMTVTHISKHVLYILYTNIIESSPSLSSFPPSLRMKGLSLSPSLEETLCHCSSSSRDYILESLELKRRATSLKSSEWIKQELEKNKDSMVQVKVHRIPHVAGEWGGRCIYTWNA